MESVLKFIVERWFDLLLTVLFLLLEWHNHVKSERSEKKMNAKLKKIKDEVEFINQMAYNREEEKFQDAREG